MGEQQPPNGNLPHTLARLVTSYSPKSGTFKTTTRLAHQDADQTGGSNELAGWRQEEPADSTRKESNSERRPDLERRGERENTGTTVYGKWRGNFFSPSQSGGDFRLACVMGVNLFMAVLNTCILSLVVKSMQANEGANIQWRLPSFGPETGTGSEADAYLELPSILAARKSINTNLVTNSDPRGPLIVEGLPLERARDKLGGKAAKEEEEEEERSELLVKSWPSSGAANGRLERLNQATGYLDGLAEELSNYILLSAGEVGGPAEPRVTAAYRKRRPDADDKDYLLGEKVAEKRHHGRVEMGTNRLVLNLLSLGRNNNNNNNNNIGYHETGGAQNGAKWDRAANLRAAADWKQQQEQQKHHVQMGATNLFKSNTNKLAERHHQQQQQKQQQKQQQQAALMQRTSRRWLEFDGEQQSITLPLLNRFNLSSSYSQLGHSDRLARPQIESTPASQRHLIVNGQLNCGNELSGTLDRHLE